MRQIDAEALLNIISRWEKPDAPGLYKRGWESVVSLINDAPTIQAIPEVEVRDEVKKAYQQGYMDGALYGMTGVNGGHDE